MITIKVHVPVLAKTTVNWTQIGIHVHRQECTLNTLQSLCIVFITALYVSGSRKSP